MIKALILFERVQAMFRCVLIFSNPLPIFLQKNCHLGRKKQRANVEI